MLYAIVNVGDAAAVEKAAVVKLCDFPEAVRVGAVDGGEVVNAAQVTAAVIQAVTVTGV